VKELELLREYSSKAEFLAKSLYDKSWSLMSQHLLDLAEKLDSDPELVEGIRQAYEQRTEALPPNERTPEWQIFRAIDRTFSRYGFTEYLIE
jgi:hypothetical protein